MKLSGGERARRYRERWPQKVKESMRLYKQKSRLAILMFAQLIRLAFNEDCRAADRVYRKKMRADPARLAKLKARERAYRKAHPQPQNHLWRKANAQRYLARQTAWVAKQRAGLSDFYIKQLIAKRRSINLSDIPQSLICAKRAHLKLQHLIKEIKQ